MYAQLPRRFAICERPSFLLWRSCLGGLRSVHAQALKQQLQTSSAGTAMTLLEAEQAAVQ